MRIQLIHLILAVATLGAHSIVCADDKPPTREEFDTLVEEVGRLKKEREQAKADAAAQQQSDLTEEIDDFVKQPSTYPQPSESGASPFLLTGFAWVNFQNMEGMDSTFRTSFVPIFLWKISDRVFFEAEIDFALTETETEVELGYAQLSFVVNDWMTIAVGKFLTPFGTFWERWHPAWINRLPTMPLMYSHDGGFVGEGLVGIQARGGVRVGSTLVNYSVYFANGPNLGTEADEAGAIEFERNLDNNNNKTFGGRIGALPLPYVEVGFSLLSGRVGDSGTVNGKVDTLILGLDFWFGREIRALKGYLEIRGELAWADTDDAVVDDENGNPFLFTNNKRQGFFVQIAWRPTLLDGFANKIELVVRFDSNKKRGPGELGIDQTRITLGVDYWVLENMPLKFAWFQNSFSEGQNRAGIVIQAAIGF